MQETMNAGATNANTIQDLIGNFLRKNPVSEIVDTLNRLQHHYLVSQDNSFGGNKQIKNRLKFIAGQLLTAGELTRFLVKLREVYAAAKRAEILSEIDEEGTIILNIPMKPTQKNLSSLVNSLNKVAEKSRTEIPEEVDFESRKAIDDINDLYWVDQIARAAKNTLVQVSTR